MLVYLVITSTHSSDAAQQQPAAIISQQSSNGQPHIESNSSSPSSPSRKQYSQGVSAVSSLNDVILHLAPQHLLGKRTNLGLQQIERV
jgi:hypothetical protein